MQFLGISLETISFRPHCQKNGALTPYVSRLDRHACKARFVVPFTASGETKYHFGHSINLYTCTGTLSKNSNFSSDKAYFDPTGAPLICS
jgi:hypothetical protein